MRLAYADPPYPGCASLYRDHPDYAGEVDHAALLRTLQDNYDGWVLHTSSVALRAILPLVPDGARVHGMGERLCGLQTQRQRRLRLGAGDRQTGQKAGGVQAPRDAGLGGVLDHAQARAHRGETGEGLPLGV